MPSKPTTTARAVRGLLALAIFVQLTGAASGQQQSPEIGYMFPPGGKAGSTVEVVLGGYNWTRDVEVFTQDSALRLELLGPPGPVLVPKPPYWFGKKARRSPFPLPRETKARLTIPSNMEPGIYRWQVANANGGSATGKFVVSRTEEFTEQPERTVPQEIGVLPAAMSGQIRKIEEVDEYFVTAPRDGPMTISLLAASLGSPLTAAVEVRDDSGRLVAEATDAEGADLQLTFAAKSAARYLLRLYDVDFRGNRSYVYRLVVTPGPRLVTAIPAAGKPGETRRVEFIGYGVATGKAELESVVREITFAPAGSSHTAVVWETPFGSTTPLMLLHSEGIEAAESETPDRRLSVPSAITGTLEQRYGADHYSIAGKKGEVWRLQLQAEAIGSPLDVALAVFDGEGKELKRNDDLSGSTDAGLEFKLPADGDYQVQVSDISGNSGSLAAVYRLVVEQATPGFALSGPESIVVPLGEQATLAVKATRRGGFQGEIPIRIEGLPAGVTVADDPKIPEGKNDAKIALTCAADTGTSAALLRVVGTAQIDGVEDAQALPPVLLAIRLKVPYSIDAEGKDDVTKWPRGTTFPAPVLIEREEGFRGEIVLEMAAKQGRHRQGIRGPEMTIPPDAKRVLYPVFLPEWLETTRTSRMVVNGVAELKDPKGRSRIVLSKLKTRIGFLPTGGLMKLACPVSEMEVARGESFTIPLTLDRAKGLNESTTIELVLNDETAGLFSAEPIVVEREGATELGMQVRCEMTQIAGEYELTLRATAKQGGQYPVLSETRVIISIEGSGQEP